MSSSWRHRLSSAVGKLRATSVRLNEAELNEVCALAVEKLRAASVRVNEVDLNGVYASAAGKLRATLANLPAILLSWARCQGHAPRELPKQRCGICMDDHEQHTMVCAGAPTASSGGGSAQDTSCSHYYCSSCMQEYVRSTVVRNRKYPVACPEQGCASLLDHNTLAALLKNSADDLQVLAELETVHALGPGNYLYCPHKTCSALLELDASSLQPGEPAICAYCERGFCATCRIPGWHTGITCEAFQRSAEDAPVLQLGADKGWHRCPACRMLVEKFTGCNHISCRCGAEFCYVCGKQYRHTAAGGTERACTCELFEH